MADIVKKDDVRFETPIVRSGLQRWFLRELYERRVLREFLQVYRKHALSAVHPDKRPDRGRSAFQALDDALGEIMDDLSIVAEPYADSKEEARESMYRSNLRQLQEARTALRDANERLQGMGREHDDIVRQLKEGHAVALQTLEDQIDRMEREHAERLENVTSQHSSRLRKTIGFYQAVLAEIGELSLFHSKLLEEGERMPAGEPFGLSLAKLPPRSRAQSLLPAYSNIKTLNVKRELTTLQRFLKRYRSLDEGTAPMVAEVSGSYLHIADPEVSRKKPQRYEFAGSLCFSGIAACVRANQWPIGKIIAYACKGGKHSTANRRLHPYFMDGIVPGALIFAKKRAVRESPQHVKEKGYEIFIPLQQVPAPE